jgi:hypothetical protein
VRIYTQREDVGILEEDSAIQYRKEGVFALSGSGEEYLRDVRYRFSENCGRDGIGWRWFPENFAFGNGVTVHKTIANYDEAVVYEDGHVLQLRDDGRYDIARVPQGVTSGWEEYEARYEPGTCIDTNHVVHLTWCVFKHELPEHAYQRLQEMIEEPDHQMDISEYEIAEEPGKYISTPRVLVFPTVKTPMTVGV